MSAIAVAIITLACGAAPGEDRPAVEVVDSAGVRLVRNLGTAADTQAVDLVEALRIGAVEGAEAYQFHIIMGAASDEGGRIYVIDEGALAVRVFDRNGGFVRQFGGPGEGPGEFGRIARLFVWRDTVHVGDIRSRFAAGALFDTAGTLLSTYASRLENGSTLTPMGASAAGWFVYDDSALASQYRERAGDVTQSLTAIARVDPRHLASAMTSRAAADSLLQPVVAYRRGRIFYALGSEGGSERFVLGNPPFFEPSPANAIDGRGFVHVAHGWPYLIDTYDAEGRLLRRMTRAHDSIPVTDALVADILRRVRAHYDTSSRRYLSDAYARRAEYPRIGYVPVTSTMRASLDGWLWVRRPDLDPDPTAYVFPTGLPPRASLWDVFDADGVLRHTVRLPPGFTVQHVTRDAVLGVDRDELGVQYVVRLTLRPRETG